MKYFSHKKESGFTLVEVLISLSIFSIAVTGVITVAARGGLTANIVKNKVTATYLADEGVELARALRDTTILGATGSVGTPNFLWQNAFVGGPDPVINHCSVAHPCDIDIRNFGGDATLPFPEVANIVPCLPVGTPCRLYYDARATGVPPAPIDPLTYGLYIDDSLASLGTPLPPSPFSRSITFDPQPHPTTSYPEDVKVSVTVTWMEGRNLKTLTQTEDLYAWYP